MFLSRNFARQTRFVAKRYFTSSSPLCATANTPNVRESLDKFFVADAPEVSTTANLVKDAINKMTANRIEDAKPILDEELEQRFQSFQNYYQEAESCIDDLREAGDANNKEYEEELQCANGAVDNCFNAFVDLLEDLRRANDKQLEAYNDLRSENVIKLKNLRNELDMIIKG